MSLLRDTPLRSALREPAAVELLRFGLVGVLQNGVNVGVFAGMLALGVPYQLCATVAAVAALAASFGLNRTFTFTASADSPVRGQFARYVVVFVAAILLSIAVLTLLVELAGIPEVPAQVIAIVLCAPPHFLAQKHWTFRRHVGALP